ncbi:MAG: hypothetical protein N2508_04825 [Anaerolineae bacterium]|nr:hypothetical protein [Anaerolineae bacterium]
MKRDLLLLFLLSLLVRLVMAALITRPGYMDTAYYAAGARYLAQGGGFNEPFLWHYLDDPAGLPRPGFLYWMPLPSILAAPFARGSFFATQLPFVLLSAALPLVSYTLACDSSGPRRNGWLAGLLTLFSGFFFPYWTLPETFAPFALLGSLSIWLAGVELGWGGRFVLGLLIGLAHLTRADGILLLAVAVLGLFFLRQSLLSGTLAILAGYLTATAPWLIRNMLITGLPLSPAGSATIWLTNYDDLFCYRCDLSLSSYLSWGWANIVRSKLWAAALNLERFLAETCLVFLFPFVPVGFLRLRRSVPFILAGFYLLLIYLAHSLIFTFPGPRGAFFHASAAALPFVLTTGVEGIAAAALWYARKRRRNSVQALRVFGGAAIALAILVSSYALLGTLPKWREADIVYEEMGRWLSRQDSEAVVMVANPPSFWYHTGLPAVVIPNGSIETLLAVAARYGVRYVLLDDNAPAPLVGLYTGEIAHPGLRRVAVNMVTDGVVLYIVQ